MVLLLGFLFIVSAVVLTFLAFPKAEAAQSGGVGRAIKALEAMGHSATPDLTSELNRPFSERVLEPFQERALAIGRRLSGADNAERLYRKLELAGNPVGWSVDRVVSMKVIGAVGGLVAFLLFSFMLDLSLFTRLIFTVGGGLVGYMSPNMYLYQKAYDRQAQLARELPDAIDLLTISVESGLAFDAAVQQVSRNTTGPLSEEFTRVLQEMQIGNGRSAALRALADRTNLDDLRSFVSAMVQADAFGIPIAQVLRVQSSEMRTKRRQKAEEKAQQVPVKMTVPLIFCILPTLFVIVLGPAALSIMSSFG
ncbi:type II secretion system F family protein [Nocardioides jishulii]|uniref:Type II secretion system F family protein n=1 Tax=Nocardioides jishulii TaxID=2575440 RepID=A0A4U2YLF3_9ACTN|nr:type II secretion system F family protein [Nocardioides jishulii]QCX27140.1 type II secretion system F family protein [Nocardioides jishulii]TKI61624.1 type II secretion system F family protein [Nocardioides jishulii]